ncbi:hypothetical protein JAAARDRAFT_45804 [Jaapia argillacea MUCL 33604]|uniref:Uncharacterized protein n=1 Tax=Jaapia argillacea MUCL 33604 TaxID=933084 RepID=A0A067QF02_9AGAM|nr:hypothetical protein JAAARDRAFT_45804 [Jaapia argillacea MUCL 33604]
MTDCVPSPTQTIYATSETTGVSTTYSESVSSSPGQTVTILNCFKKRDTLGLHIRQGPTPTTSALPSDLPPTGGCETTLSTIPGSVTTIQHIFQRVHIFRITDNVSLFSGGLDYEWTSSHGYTRGIHRRWRKLGYWRHVPDAEQDSGVNEKHRSDDTSNDPRADRSNPRGNLQDPHPRDLSNTGPDAHSGTQQGQQLGPNGEVQQQMNAQSQYGNDQSPQRLTGQSPHQADPSQTTQQYTPLRFQHQDPSQPQYQADLSPIAQQYAPQDPSEQYVDGQSPYQADSSQMSQPYAPRGSSPLNPNGQSPYQADSSQMTQRYSPQRQHPSQSPYPSDSFPVGGQQCNNRPVDGQQVNSGAQHPYSQPSPQQYTSGTGSPSSTPSPSGYARPYPITPAIFPGVIPVSDSVPTTNGKRQRQYVGPNPSAGGSLRPTTEGRQTSPHGQFQDKEPSLYPAVVRSGMKERHVSSDHNHLPGRSRTVGGGITIGRGNNGGSPPMQEILGRSTSVQDTGSSSRGDLLRNPSGAVSPPHRYRPTSTDQPPQQTNAQSQSGPDESSQPSTEPRPLQYDPSQKQYIPLRFEHQDPSQRQANGQSQYQADPSLIPQQYTPRDPSQLQSNGQSPYQADSQLSQPYAPHDPSQPQLNDQSPYQADSSQMTQEDSLQRCQHPSQSRSTLGSPSVAGSPSSSGYAHASRIIPVTFPGAMVVSDSAPPVNGIRQGQYTAPHPSVSGSLYPVKEGQQVSSHGQSQDEEPSLYPVVVRRGMDRGDVSSDPGHLPGRSSTIGSGAAIVRGISGGDSSPMKELLGRSASVQEIGSSSNRAPSGAPFGSVSPPPQYRLTSTSLGTIGLDKKTG